MLRSRFILFLVLCLGAVAPIAAQNRPSLPPETVQKVEAIVAREMAERKIPAMSVAIAVDGQVRYEKGFGTADLENSVPATEATVFRTASIAKPITATAVMQLAEQGKLDLDAPIQKYCPAFPEKQWPVTARLLLGHLSGVRHYARPGESSGTQHYFAIADSLVLFKDDPLLHEPGEKMTYTTYGYSVLGCAVEGASGMPFDEYLREHVFKRAGMLRTDVDNTYLLIPNRARGYQRLDAESYAQLPEDAKRIAKAGEVYNAVLHDTSMKIPGGGLVSTAGDLVRFALAVRDGRLLKPETIAQVWTSGTTKDGKETEYGFGWGIGSLGDQKLVTHSGGQAGTSTYLAMLPERGIVIALMCNLEGNSLRSIVDEIGGVLLAK